MLLTFIKIYSSECAHPAQDVGERHVGVVEQQDCRDPPLFEFALNGTPSASGGRLAERRDVLAAARTIAALVRDQMVMRFEPQLSPPLPC